MRTTYGSTIFADHVPAADGMLAERLRRAGAIIIGKTNTPEFGAGSNTFNRVFGATRNPYDARAHRAAVSGGAAVAVATGMLPFADGSDLGVSIRNPASFCGVVGLRPSPGRIPAADPESDPWSRWRCSGRSRARVDDAALLLGALAGRDGRDPKSVAAPPDALDPVVPASLAGLRVAWSRNLGDLPVASGGHRSARAAPRPARRARRARHGRRARSARRRLRVRHAARRRLRRGRAADGGARGRAQGDDRLEHPQGIGAERRRDRPRVRGPRRRYAAIETFLRDYDVLALPTAQVLPFPVEQEWVEEIEGVEMEHYVAWLRSCSRITVTGHPAISIPAGWTDTGLPVGLQLVGRHLEERRLLSVAAAFEAAFDCGRTAAG